MNQDQREYSNAIIKVAYDFIITDCNKNIPMYVLKDHIKSRQYINDFLTMYNEKVPESANQNIDKILQFELGDRKIADASNLLKSNGVSIWQGDITSLYIDCIVNCANEKGTGCYIPGHKCVDNIIHSRAGPRMREECKTILTRYNQDKIATGDLIITLGYNIPARHVFHVVGPIYKDHRETENRMLLIKSYLTCLTKLRDIRKRSIAFCCISTGEYGYPKQEACVIAINTVKRWINENKSYPIHVVFCTYTDEDMKLYTSIYNKLS